MELKVEKRDIQQKPKKLRSKGLLPAVVYGRSEKSTPITIDRKTFDKLFHAAGESTVITLSGLGEDKDALIHEVDVDVVTGVPIHVDFYAIEKGQTVTVSIPFEFEGESPAVKEGLGILVKVMHEIEIECEPRDLPKAIHIDTSKLVQLNDKITVGDLKFPASAKLTASPEDVVAMITEIKEEAVEEAPADLSAIEISEERGKKEEEGAETAGTPAEAPKAKEAPKTKKE